MFAFSGVLALARRANLYDDELTDEAILTLLWILESFDSQYRSCLTSILERYTWSFRSKEFVAQSLRRSMLDLQGQFLQRCGWQVNIDADDVRAALLDLRETPGFFERCRSIEEKAVFFNISLEEERAAEAIAQAIAQKITAPKNIHCPEGAYDDDELFPGYEVDEISPKLRTNAPVSKDPRKAHHVFQHPSFPKESYSTPMTRYRYSQRQRYLQQHQKQQHPAAGGAAGKRARTATPRKARNSQKQQAAKKTKYGWI